MRELSITSGVHCSVVTVVPVTVRSLLTVNILVALGISVITVEVSEVLSFIDCQTLVQGCRTVVVQDDEATEERIVD